MHDIIEKNRYQTIPETKWLKSKTINNNLKPPLTFGLSSSFTVIIQTSTL